MNDNDKLADGESIKVSKREPYRKGADDSSQ
jgi:hypothetical protein